MAVAMLPDMLRRDRERWGMSVVEAGWRLGITRREYVAIEDGRALTPIYEEATKKKHSGPGGRSRGPVGPVAIHRVRHRSSRVEVYRELTIGGHVIKDPTGTIAPILVVRDVEKAVNTYTRVFGFEPLRYFDGNDEYIPLGHSGAQLHVMKGERANPNHIHAAHVADVFFWVEDFDNLITSARDAGLAIKRGPERYDSTPLATSEVVIEDQDGYWFCFALAHLP